MTWSDFYLICFAIGFLLSFISFLSGGLRWHLHIPHTLHFGGGHLPVGHAPVGHATGAAGLAGATVVFLFLTRVLMSREETMDPADYEMVGVLGRLSNPIREGGTGEIIYSQAGTRRTCGARSENGGALEKGAEVVVTRYEKGIAYVQRWEEMANE